MAYRYTIDATTYVFADLRELLAKATPFRSGDRLAGVAAASAEEMIAARMALADTPLSQFLQQCVVSYDDDEVTRLIVDTHDAQAFALRRNYRFAHDLKRSTTTSPPQPASNTIAVSTASLTSSSGSGCRNPSGPLEKSTCAAP